MITIPSVLNHKNVAVYPDDEDCNMFYAIKTSPEIRLAPTGEPVFSGLFWTDQADGAAGNTAGINGAWINFDAHLGVSEQVLKEISDKLKSGRVQENRRKVLIKKEKERLGLIAKARGESTIPDPDIPPIQDIRFGALNFTEGTVTLLEEQAGELVGWSSAGGPASLIGDNNAAFALRLNPKGAAIWLKSLQAGVKAISIRFDLKFQLRLPSLEIRAWAGSTQESEVNRKVDRVWRNTDQGCSDADVERIDVKEVTEKLVEEGLMNIEIKKGSSEISDEHVSQLRNMAMKLIEDKVQEIIKSRIHGMTAQERSSSMIQLMSEEVRSFVELRFTQEDVVEWKISPQGTIMNFLEGIPDNKKQQITKVVDLSEHEVETISIDTSAEAPWDEPPFVNAVKVILEYPSANEKHSVLFKKGDPKNTWHFRRPKKDSGEAKYTTEVYFKGISEPAIIKEKSSNSDTINVNVGKIGLIDVTFSPHPILASLTGNNAVTAIQVDVSYKEEGDPEHFTDSLVLKVEELEGKKLTRIIGKAVDAPLVWTATYFSKDGSSLQIPQKKSYLTENNQEKIEVPTPYQDSLSLNVELAATPDASVRKILVEFKYEDKVNNFSSIDKVDLSAEEEWETASIKLVLLDKTQRNYQYRYRIVSEDNIARSGWIQGEESEETLILPIYKVTINPSLLKIGTNFANAFLTLQHDDGGIINNKECFLDAESGAKPLSWFIPRTNMNATSYSYNLTLVKDDGTSVETSGTNQGSMLTLKAP